MTPSPGFDYSATPGVDERELTNFMTAASGGNVAGMQAYIDKYGSGKIDAIRGEPAAATALYWAAKAGNVTGIGFLIDHGAKIDGRDLNGDTPLLVAAWMGRAEAVEFLLLRGADLNAANNDGQNVMSRAANHPEVQQAVFRFMQEKRAERLREIRETVETMNTGLTQPAEIPVTTFKKRPKP